MTEFSLGEYAPKSVASAPVWVRVDNGYIIFGKITVNTDGSISGQYIESLNSYAKDFSSDLNMYLHGQVEWYL